MKRKIIQIDEAKCNGCGLCVAACHEGALQLVNGKAKLISDSYCDGLGDCLPECPVDAISIEEREAAAYDETAVNARMGTCEHPSVNPEAPIFSCPGSQARMIERQKTETAPTIATPTTESQLRQWPCQLQLVPVNAAYFDNAHLLIAADCAAYAYANIHQDFMRNKITVIGCPKLDEADYAKKLTDILSAHEIKSVTVLRMEVPCCGALANAAKTALANCGKMIPWNIFTIRTDGQVIEN